MTDLKRPVAFVVEHARRLGFDVPDPVSRFTPYLEAVAKGRRFKRNAPVHHTPKLNLRTGQPHAESRAAARRRKQQERAAWNEFERERRKEG